MYVNFSCYYSLYGFVVGTRMVTTEPMVVSNPMSVGYTIYMLVVLVQIFVIPQKFEPTKINTGTVYGKLHR